MTHTSSSSSLRASQRGSWGEWRSRLHPAYTPPRAVDQRGSGESATQRETRAHGSPRASPSSPPTFWENGRRRGWNCQAPWPLVPASPPLLHYPHLRQGRKELHRVPASPPHQRSVLGGGGTWRRDLEGGCSRSPTSHSYWLKTGKEGEGRVEKHMELLRRLYRTYV